MATMVMASGEETGRGRLPTGRTGFISARGRKPVVNVWSGNRDGMLRVLREKILVQAMLRLSCRRYIEALCSRDEAEARRLFSFYKRLERLDARIEALDSPGADRQDKPEEAGGT